MWYISFHGGASGKNNIHVYDDSGQKSSEPKLLPTGDPSPKLRELRGFALTDGLLYVVNAYLKYSQILVYEPDANGQYQFKEVFASRDTVNSILHPYDLTFDTQGNCYVTNQDTNVVTGLQGPNRPLPVAAYLKQNYPPSPAFLAGTMVASSNGKLPNISTPPPNVPKPQGLKVIFSTSTPKKVAHSARGLLFHSGYLYVADEPANAVKVYNGASGELKGQIQGKNLRAPVQLLVNANFLYISSSGNDSVVSFDLAQGAPSGTVAPITFIDGKVKSISGLAFDSEGNFYAAERKTKKIRRFPQHGSGTGEDFIKSLPDEPEFILYVQNSTIQKGDDTFKARKLLSG